MNEGEKIDKLQEIADLFKETAVKLGFEEFIVMWGCNLPSNETASGVIISDSLEVHHFEHLVFKLLGRSFNMIDYNQ